MKKRLLPAVLAVIICESIVVLGILLYLLYFSGNHSSAGTIGDSIDAYKETKLRSASFYNIKADIETTKNIVSIKEEISFKSPSKRFLAYVPSINSADTSIKSISSSGGSERFSLNGTMLEINCKSTQSSISVEYEIALETNTGTLAYKDNVYYLTNFLITPALYNGENPVLSYKCAFGDPYIYDINNYYIMFKTDKSMNIYAPGLKEEHVFGSNKLTIFEAQGIRDFPAVLSADAEVVKKTYKDIDIYYINSSEAHDFVVTTLEFAGNNINPYPYDSFFVVKAPISQKGMEFSNMIFIGNSCFNNKDELKRVTYHEVLHQWFYGIIGTDQLNEPFFDEGLVNYLSIALSSSAPLGDKLKETSGRKFMHMSLNSYGSREEYYSFAYNDSAAYFYTIHKKLGNNFYRLLKELYNEKKYKIAYFDDFIKILNKYAGGNYFGK